MICRLCLKDKDIRLSHVIPDFLYKTTYDEKHRALEINFNHPKKINLLQKGYREKLLCNDCEQFLNTNFEIYFNDLWYEKESRPDNISNNHVVLTGIDYGKFKLFLLSILWRSSISSHKAFRLIEVGEHQEKLRNKLINLDAGLECEYPIFPQFLLAPNSNVVFDGVIFSPTINKLNNTTSCLFVFGGVCWFYFLDPIYNLEKYPISKSGEITFGVKHFEEIKIFTEPLKELYLKGLIN